MIVRTLKPLDDGALLAQGDRHFDGFGLNAAPDVQFLLEHEALLDDEHFHAIGRIVTSPSVLIAGAVSTTLSMGTRVTSTLSRCTSA